MITNSTVSSLVDALALSIERINENFEKHWLFRGESTDSISSNLEGAGREYYEKVFETEYHNFTELCICIEGSFALQLGEQIETINQGSVAIILPGILHNEMPTKADNYIAVWITFAVDKIRLHLSGKNDIKGFFTFDGCSLNHNYECNLILNNIKREADNNGQYNICIIKAQVLQMLILLLRDAKNVNYEDTDNEPWKISVTEEVKALVERNYSRHISLEEISATVCISPNYLNTIFKSVTKKTIIQHIEDLKISKAKSLLRETTLSIAEISEKLGYYDQYHFSKSFKKETGIAPIHFRKMA